MKHAVRVFTVLTFGLAACAQMPSESPAGGRGNGVQEAAAVDDREPWTAVGNEPGWLLKIDAVQLMLRWNYGEEEAVLPRPEPAVSPNGRSYVSRTGAHDLRVDVTYRICRDTMTGMPYPHQVSVIIDDTTLSGCGGSPASLLQSGEWVVEDLAGKGIVDRSQATLDFDRDGQLAGRASCNTYGATWRLNGEGLTIAKIRATRMACSPALDRQETEFLNLLEVVHYFDITDDGALFLHTANGATIKARRE